MKERVEEFISKFSEVIQLEKESKILEAKEKPIIVETEDQSSPMLIPISVAFLSFILWSFEKLFDITFLSELPNWTLVKYVIQLTLILGGVAVKTKRKGFWLGGFIPLILALIMLLKE